ncbi:hypothetical protein EG834_19380, partial [bacterium]|nr:hypothetical protein [bacterium]
SGPLLLIAVGVVLILVVLIWELFMSQSNGAALGASQATATSEIPYAEITRTSLQDARAAYDAKTAVFIDVRSADSFAQQHISGALSLPLDQIEAQIPDLDRQAWIIPYCT